MIHRRTTTDSAPVGVASRRALRVVRSACDAAPATDAVTGVVIGVEHDPAFWLPLEVQFETVCLIVARGPPGGY